MGGMGDENTELLREIRDILAQIQTMNQEQLAQRDAMLKKGGRNILIAVALIVFSVVCLVLAITLR